MPAESIAVALPGAFMACVQCFQLIQFGRNFKDDFAVCAADLKICEIHLLRWGTAAGLNEADGTELPKKLSKYPEDQLQKGLLVLEQIVSIFHNTKKMCHFESTLDDDKEDGSQPSIPLNEDVQLQTQEAKWQKSHKHLDKAKAKYRSSLNAMRNLFQDAGDRTKWALYKKVHLTALIKQVSELIDRLEKLFPELLQVEQKLAQEEVKGAEKEVVQTLPALAAEIDPVMTEALTVQMKSYGMTFEDVEAGDYVRVHLGNVYAPGEKSTGHDDHQWKKLKIDGHAVFHGGNVYGKKLTEEDGGTKDDQKQ